MCWVVWVWLSFCFMLPLSHCCFVLCLLFAGLLRFLICWHLCFISQVVLSVVSVIWLCVGLVSDGRDCLCLFRMVWYHVRLCDCVWVGLSLYELRLVCFQLFGWRFFAIVWYVWEFWDYLRWCDMDWDYWCFDVVCSMLICFELFEMFLDVLRVVDLFWAVRCVGVVLLFWF